MKKRILLIVTLCLLLTNIALASRMAEGTVTIQADRQFLSVNYINLHGIIYSPAVASRAIKTVLKADMSVDDIRKIIKFTDHPGGSENNNRYTCYMRIVLPKNTPPVAEELLKAFTESLIIAIDEAYLDFIKQKSVRTTILKQKINIEKEQLGKLNKRYSDFIKTHSIPNKNISSYLSKLKENISDDEFQLMSNQAILDSLKKRKDELNAQAGKLIKDDPIAKQLGKLVEIEAADLKRMQDLMEKKKVIGPVIAFDQIKKRLLEAQIELAKRQEVLQQQTQPELIEISKMITNRTLEVSVYFMQAKSSEIKLEDAKKSLEYSHEYETLELERQYGQKNLKQAMGEYHNSMRDINKLSPPTVVAIGIK